MRGELQVQLSRVVSQEMCVDRRERLKGPGPNSMLHLERKLSPSPYFNPVWLSGWQPVGISPVQPQAQCSPVPCLPMVGKEGRDQTPVPNGLSLDQCQPHTRGEAWGPRGPPSLLGPFHHLWLQIRSDWGPGGVGGEGKREVL